MAPQESVKTWPARYKNFQIGIHESHRHLIWIDSKEIRKVIPTLRADKQLEKEYSTDFRSVDTTGRIFFSERALKQELQLIRTRDALMFLSWLEKQIYYPAARKRGDAHASAPMPEKTRTADEPEDSGQDLHIPTRKLAPPAKPSLPLTAPIRQQSDLSRRLDANKAVRFRRGQYAGS